MPIMLPYENFHLYADRNIKEKLVSGYYTMPVLLKALAGKQSCTPLMPDQMTVVGRELNAADKEKFKGTQYAWRWQATDVDDSGVVGYKGTSTAATDYTHEHLKSAQVSPFELETPVRVENHILEAAAEKASAWAAAGDRKRAGAAIGSVIGDASSMKMSTHMLNLQGRLWTGTPSSFSADIADNIIGVNAWLSDDNDIATVDRSLAGNAEFRAQFTDVAQVASLDWITKIKNLGVAKAVGTTEPLRKYGSKADLLICDPAIFDRLRTEYSNRVGVRDTKWDQHKNWVGTLDNWFMYDNTVVVGDYDCPVKSCCWIPAPGSSVPCALLKCPHS